MSKTRLANVPNLGSVLLAGALLALLPSAASAQTTPMDRVIVGSNCISGNSNTNPNVAEEYKEEGSTLSWTAAQLSAAQATSDAGNLVLIVTDYLQVTQSAILGCYNNCVRGRLRVRDQNGETFLSDLQGNPHPAPYHLLDTCFGVGQTTTTYREFLLPQSIDVATLEVVFDTDKEINCTPAPAPFTNSISCYNLGGVQPLALQY